MVNHDEILDYKTPFAQKYGVMSIAKDKKQIFYNHGKSGYTPTKPSGLHPLSSPEIRRNIEIERQQKKLMYGFTAKELVELGSYPDTDATLSVLQNGIHPIFQRVRWETSVNPHAQSQRLFKVVANEPCYGTGDGTWWTADNDIVWDMLQPVLKLASRLLADTLTIPQLDTLLCGEYYSVPRNEDPRSDETRHNDGQLWAVRPRHPSQYGDPVMLAEKHAALQLVQSKIRLKIGDGNFTHDNVTAEPSFVHGTMLPDFDLNDYQSPARTVDIMLPWQILQPLLRKDLYPSEQLIEQFLCASTLVHETMHAVHASLAYSDVVNKPWYSQMEPVFEPQIFSEAGFALEVDLHNGVVVDVPNSSPGNLHACVFVMNHPNRTEKDTSPAQVIRGGDNAVPLITYARPLPAEYFYNINDEVYWIYAIRRWGIDMLRPQPAAWSVYDPRSRLFQTHRTRFPGANSRNWEIDLQVEFKNKDPRFALMNKTPQEVAAWKTALEINRQTQDNYNRSEFRLHRVQTGLRIQNWFDDIGKTETPTTSEQEVSDDEDPDDDLPNTPLLTPEISYILDDLHTEAYAQAQEIITFKTSSITVDPNEPYNLAWLHYLQHINREARAFSNDLEMRVNSESQNMERHHINKLNQTISVLITSFRILNSSRADIYKSPTNDWKNFLAQVWQVLEPNFEAAKAEARAWDEANFDWRAEAVFFTKILDEGREALEKGDQEGCMRLGVEIFRKFAWNAFMRAAGTVLLSRTGVVRDRELWREIGGVEEDALNEEDEEGLVSEEVRMWWSGWVLKRREVGERSGRGTIFRPRGGSGVQKSVGSHGVQGGRVEKRGQPSAKKRVVGRGEVGTEEMVVRNGFVACTKHGKGSERKGRSFVEACASAEYEILETLREDAMDSE